MQPLGWKCPSLSALRGTWSRVVRRSYKNPYDDQAGALYCFRCHLTTHKHDQWSLARLAPWKCFQQNLTYLTLYCIWPTIDDHDQYIPEARFCMDLTATPPPSLRTHPSGGDLPPLARSLVLYLRSAALVPARTIPPSMLPAKNPRRPPFQPDYP